LFGGTSTYTFYGIQANLMGNLSILEINKYNPTVLFSASTMVGLKAILNARSFLKNFSIKTLAF